LVLLAFVSTACGPAEPPPPEQAIIPAYDEQTGRLERLTSDRNGDGKIDTWAYMDGPRLEHVELDRDGDEIPDRWEYYQTPAGGASGADSAPGTPVIVRAEERRGPDQPVTRQEFFERGILQRVEEDTDGDGRVNKWEQHANGKLVRVDLDLQGKGFPNRRLIYGPGGVQRVEVDPDGDGVFEPAPAGKPGQ
jgi:hypothetical protein